MEYAEFIESKIPSMESHGLEAGPINPMLFDFQVKIVQWALKRGRAAIFADCGLGKTPIQLEWARQIPGDVLILAPLAVASQTALEGDKFGCKVTVCRTQADCRPGINITNYEMLEHFDREQFAGIVLDESSILKAFGGVMRKQITEFARVIKYRLCCTATPAPNDLVELTNHAEFLELMSGKEIIALYFTQDGNTTHSWRLKGHAKHGFWSWLAEWSVAIRKPSDLGFPDDGFILPKLDIIGHEVEVDCSEVGQLFPVEAQGLLERRRARAASIDQRVQLAADLVNASDEPWIVWCGLNKESERLAKLIPDAVEVRGSDLREHKETSFQGFANGNIRVIVTKSSIAGLGLNWQHCNKAAFVGLSDSYEQFYQSVRRCWRFGQNREVTVHVITAETEGAVTRNIRRKEKQSEEMMEQIVNHTRELQMGQAVRKPFDYQEDSAFGDGWRLDLGDSIKRINDVEDESAGMVLFSPPFPGMYAYTNSENDIGNSDTIDQMIEHFNYLAIQLPRVMMPGRMCCIHLMQVVAMKSRDGYIGLKDYRGRVIEMMTATGLRYAGEVTIDKNPQIQATRNKERGLLFKSLATDSSMMRMALADYLIYFRKDGENPAPIKAGISERHNNPDGWITEKEWIEWAAPVWYRRTKDYPGGIWETDVLNVRQARETDDERHLCPLQLGVIERAVKLWTNPGDVVYSPFAGVGSEGYVSLRLGRQFRGCELKRSYWETAASNLRDASSQQPQESLF